MECFGSHPKHVAIQVSLNQCLVADVSHQHKSMLVVVDCLTCYDTSVAHPQASLACQWLGAPPSLLCTILQLIQMMKFFLQMAHGDSNQFYGADHATLPFQGVCQGNGARPAIWLAVSIILMDMVWAHGFSATFPSPISHQSTTLLDLLYVDDCDLFTIINDGLKPIETIHHLQTNINTWQGRLLVSGGALSPAKSSWCILSMHPQGSWWSYHTTASLPTMLTVINSNHQPHPIR